MQEPLTAQADTSDLLVPPTSDGSTGSQAPFDGLPAPIQTALTGRGFTELTSVQSAVLEAGLGRGDLWISSQTGSGKTVALGLVLTEALQVPVATGEGAPPAGPTALILVPTRELAGQLQMELSWLYANLPGVRVECVTGGTDVWRERQRLARTPRVLIGTPGRLLDHIRSGAVALGGVTEVVLDEADQMLDMGFREDLEAILDATPTERRTHLVSATFPSSILRLAERYQRDPQHIEGSRLGAANADIKHIAHLVDGRSRYGALVNILLLAGDERTLVFVNTRVDTARIADQLAADGFSALPLSGELQQSQRARTLAAFRSGKVSVLVATDVAARGLDVPDVATVLHAEAAMDSQTYTHRSGRTGRAGQEGRSVILVPTSKERGLRRMLRNAKVDVDWCAAPSAKDVARVLKKRERRAVYAALEGAAAPSSDQVEFATRLLEDRDPAEVVAILLAQAPKPAGGKPVDLKEVQGFNERPGRYERPDRGRNGSQGRPSYQNRSGHSSGQGAARPVHTGTRTNGSSHERPAAPRNDQYVRFFLNWGEDNGANPKRVLAHICRRGGIEGRNVGAIRLSERFSTFEVRNDVAADFEAKASRRDSRDPKLRIERARERSFSKPERGANLNDRTRAFAG